MYKTDLGAAVLDFDRNCDLCEVQAPDLLFEDLPLGVPIEEPRLQLAAKLVIG